MPRFYKYQVDASYFTNIDMPGKAYWLGVMAADGSLYYHGNKWVLQFIVTQRDQEWIEAFKGAIHSTHPLRVLPGGFDTPCVRLVITNQVLSASLIALEFKSDTVLQHVPEHLWCHFVRGLFDGDGCIRKDVGKPRHTGYAPSTLEWSLVSQSFALLRNIQAVFQKYCGVVPNKMRFHNNVWVWAVRGNRQVKRIAEYIYPEGV
jgi:LAGLIDADG-like domain